MNKLAKVLVSRKAMAVGMIWVGICTILEIGSSIYFGSQVNILALGLLYGIVLFWNKCVKELEKEEAEEALEA